MSNRRPAKLLPVKFQLQAALPADPAGRIYQYNARLTMTNPQMHSSSIHGNKQFTLEDLRVGDYVSTTGNGRIMKIVTITTAASFDATVVVEDDYRLNQIQDSSGDAIPYIESQNGVVFEVVEGKPVLFPYSEYSTSVIGFVRDYAAELFSRFNFLRQHTLVDIYQQGHSFAPGDLITWTAQDGWTLMQSSDNYIGIVVEHNEPYAGWFRFRPNGEVLNLELTGTGPLFYWDPDNPGKLTETVPAAGERLVLAFYKLNDREAIFFTNNPAQDFGDQFVTIGTDQTITGDKTFTGVVNFNGGGGTTVFNQDVDITANLDITNNLSVTQNVTIGGDLTVSGTTTTVDTENTQITDRLIELNQGYTGPPMSADSGIVINKGPNEDNLFFGWDEDDNVFTVGTGGFDGSAEGNLTLTDAPVRFGTTSVTDSLTVGTLTENRIVIVGTDGLLEDDPNFTWDGNELGIGGTGVAFTTGKVNIGNNNDNSIDHTMFVAYNTTTDASATTLYLDGSSTGISVPNNTTMLFEADVVGRDTNGLKHCSFQLKGVIDNTGGTTVLVNNVSETIVAETTEAWSAVAIANNAANALDIVVTGETNVQIKWVAFVKTTQISM